MSILIKQRELTSGIVGVAVALLCVGVLHLTVVGVVAACVLAPIAYFGTDLLIRANGTKVLLGEGRSKALQECLALEGQLQSNLNTLSRGSESYGQIEGIAAVSGSILEAMRKDPGKMADITNFELNYLQPVAKAVETYVALSQQSLPAHAGDPVRSRLASLFPKALTELKKYEQIMYTGDVQQLEGLVDMLEQSFPGGDSAPDPATAAPAPAPQTTKGVTGDEPVASDS